MNKRDAKKDVMLALLELDRPIIPMCEPVEHGLYERVRDSLIFLETRGCPRIQIRLDTRGGSVDAGLDIYDLLTLYPGGVDGTVINSADSMGAVIMQACKERSCARHASLLIHHISRDRVSLDDLTDDARRAKVVARMSHLQNRIYKILAARTGKGEDEIREVCKKDESMTAEEALAFGLIDKIIDGEVK